MKSNNSASELLMASLAKKTAMTIENCIVDLFLGLKVKYALAKYENIEATIKAIAFEKKAPAKNLLLFSL